MPNQPHDNTKDDGGSKPSRTHFLFLEITSPPPFFQPQLSKTEREQLDKWFIGTRSQSYYLKRFSDFDDTGRLGRRWHWAAFFMTLPWLLYRKRFLDALVYTVAGWSFIQLNVVLALLVLEYSVLPFLPAGWHMGARVLCAVLVWLGYSALVASWADAYYYRMARREIADVVESGDAPEQARATLARLGGVSMVGMALAFGLFVFALMVVKQQFLPVYAKQQEAKILYAAYDTLTQSKLRADAIVKQSGQCPDVPTTTVSKPFARFSVTIAHTPAYGVPVTSRCHVRLSIDKVHFPNRSLNGRQFVYYLDGQYVQHNNLENARWRCIASLNKAQTPKACQLD